MKFSSMVLILLLSATSTLAFEMGVNIHFGGGSLSANQQFADIMKTRNIKSARMDYGSGINMTNFRDQIQKIRANGGSVQVTLQTAFQWNYTCPQDLANVEQSTYNESYTLVNQLKDLVYDYELLNEVQLRPEIQSIIPYNSAGLSVSVWQGKPCVNSLVAALKGMSRAIRDVRANSGLPLRSIMGVIGRDFGLLTYLEQQGVQFDVTGYHIYPHVHHPYLSNDEPWYGPGGLYGQLAKFNRPVHLNEINCGEIFDSNYDNLPGSSATENCLKAIDKHMTDLKNQKVINLEFVHVYELMDQPQRSGAERHAGIMYDAANPKAHLFLVSAFAGGYLSAAEQQAITSRGLLTDAEIAAYKASGGGSTPVTTTTTTTTTTSTTSTTMAPSPSPGDTIATISNTNYVSYLYKFILGRDPDSGGLDAYVAALNNGMSKVDVQKFFLASSEYQSRLAADNYSPTASTGALSNQAFVNQLYVVLLLRDPASAEVTAYTNAMLAGTSRAAVVKSFMTSSEYQQKFGTTAPPPPTADTVAPSVSITSPANNSSLARNSLVLVTASASDNIGVSQVQFYLNGSLICTDLAAAYQCQVRLPRKARTSTIEAVARDAAGNIGRHSITVFGR